jgi:hypothetical protein
MSTAASMRKLTRANHIGTISRNFPNFVVEFVENFIILCAVITHVKWRDISLLLLLEPGISISNVANCGKI